MKGRYFTLKKFLFTLIISFIFISPDITTNANTYDNLTYVINNNEITITACDTSVEVLKIPSSIDNYPVTQIESYAFLGCVNLTKAYIPDSITSLGLGIFSGCSSLEELTLPFIGAGLGGSEGMLKRQSVFGYIFGCKTQNEEGLTKQNYNSSSYAYYKIPSSLKKVTITNDTFIPYGAFENCIYINSISIPNSVTAIDANAFRNCKSLKEIIMSNNITLIRENAFYNCEKLCSITIPDGVDTISNHSFAYCSSLTTINIPNSVTAIGTGAFSDCTALTTIIIPNSVNRIGSCAFTNCISLKEISLPFIGYDRSSSKTKLSVLGHIFEGSDSNNTYAVNQNYNNKVGSTIKVNIPSSLEKITITDARTIPYGAFSGCSSIKTIIITGNNISTIQSYAFYNCSNLEFVNIPKCIETIESYAFSGCNLITSITLPNNIKTIDKSAFYQCASFTTIYGNSNSFAQEFALQHNYTFISVNEIMIII